MTGDKIIVKYLGRSDYRETWDRMKQFTRGRDENTADELWITEHDAVFTQGLNGKAEHLLDTGDIDVIQIDRGGQVTYHGPGQLVIYCLLDIQRLNIGVRALVAGIENSITSLLRRHHIDAKTEPGAPGVYVDGCKIAALGLRIRKGCCYHGLSLNINMDLEPFSRINPCGYSGLAVTQMSDLDCSISLEQAGQELAELLLAELLKENLS